jgi:hypothetical protein
MSQPMSPRWATAFRAAAAALQMREQLAEQYTTAIDRMKLAQRALRAAADADDNALLAKATFEAHRADVIRRAIGERLRHAEKAAASAFETYFVEDANARGLSLDGSDLSGALAASLRLVKGQGAS